MTYSPAAFDRFCLEATQQFLQTVVVIDNEAVFQLEKRAEEVEREELPDVTLPADGSLTKSSSGEENPVQTPEQAQVEEQEDEGNEVNDDSSPNILYAKPLIDEFADNGIVCSVMRPDPDEGQVVQRAITVASAADILVVDWMLGKAEGSDDPEDLRAREIIRGVIEKDLEKRGRLRLIAIYTAEHNPQDILDILYEYIKDLQFPDGKINKDPATFTLHNRFLKIAVLLKPVAGVHVPGNEPIEPEALPGELQKLFSSLNTGLLPSITLRAIAAIREETHHLLAVFHKDLDAALVGHRCLLPEPRDGEEFCEDLVAGEIRSILAMGEIGSRYAGESANKTWIGARIEKGKPLSYSKFHIDRESLFSLVNEGQKAHKKVFNKFKVDWLERELEANQEFKDKDGNDINLEVAKKRIEKGDPAAATQYKIPSVGVLGITSILSEEEKKGQKINFEFSRLCSFKREAVGLRKPTENWMPHLTLGTLLQRKGNEDDTYLLCLQPRCESVRLEKGEKRTFPFLVISKGKKKDFICFNGFDDDNKVIEKSLYYEAKPKNQVVFEFESCEGDAIISRKANELYMFRDTSGNNEFIWLGDLKDVFAQNIVDALSSVVGSVGLNPYEWQRRKSK
jgi:response regulator receiver domain-containing protein